MNIVYLTVSEDTEKILMELISKPKVKIPVKVN